MEIPYVSYYANDMSFYTNYPHELLYWAYGWMGNISKAQEHILKALEYQPYNSMYLRDTQFYFEYSDNKIPGWMTFNELQWLYNNAKKMNSILEIGSWKGRSSHALLSGCKGTVTCVDHFEGSGDSGDYTHMQGKKEDIYEQFVHNVGHFKNLEVIKASSEEASVLLKDRTFDLIFIDAEHTYESVKKDIELWKNKANIVIAGHDYCDVWPAVKKAVNDCFPQVEVSDSIWYYYIKKDS
jgi:hypothetical protein